MPQVKMGVRRLNTKRAKQGWGHAEDLSVTPLISYCISLRMIVSAFKSKKGSWHVDRPHLTATSSDLFGVERNNDQTCALNPMKKSFSLTFVGSLVMSKTLYTAGASSQVRSSVSRRARCLSLLWKKQSACCWKVLRPKEPQDLTMCPTKTRRKWRYLALVSTWFVLKMEHQCFESLTFWLLTPATDKLPQKTARKEDHREGEVLAQNDYSSSCSWHWSTWCFKYGRAVLLARSLHVAPIPSLRGDIRETPPSCMGMGFGNCIQWSWMPWECT